MSNKLANTEQQRIAGEIKANNLIAPIGRALQKHYPGWLWHIDHTWGTGVVTVKNLSLIGDYGFVLHTRTVETESNERLAVIAGGELLERCGFPRGPRPKGPLERPRTVRGDIADVDKELLPGSKL